MKVYIDKNSRSGFAMAEALIYIACLTVFLSIVSVAIWRMFSSQARLTERSERLAKILNIGERWRAEIRSSELNPAALAQANGNGTALKTDGLPFQYEMAGENLLRVTEGRKEVLLRNVVFSNMKREDRRGIVFWQWDVEIRLDHTSGKTQVFTFMAVPAKQPNP